jgi:TonB-dependent starch-binding outer membrane protein SusC
MQKIYPTNPRRKRRVLLNAGVFALLILAAFAPFAPGAQAHALVAIRPALAIDVTGTITDATGAAVPGVNVLEKGTSNGTVSDANGRYAITVASGESILVFSFVGMVTQQVTVGNRSEVSVQMTDDASTLGEVVVVGYGTQEKRDVTSAVGSVQSGEFNRGIINSPEQLVQGKIAGVNVTSSSGEPGGNQSITIRGPGGVRTGSTPLFVVDGMALDNSSTGGSTNPMNFLNPQDIESIDVLKDASATAIYGSRGANGVILITTKRGKAGRTSVSYNGSVGVSKMTRKLDVFTADEYREIVPSLGGILVDGGANTDWQEEVTRQAITKNHNLSLSGGADKISYFASLGMQDQEGIIRTSNMKRYNARINVTQKAIQDRLTVDLNLTASNTINNRPPSDGNNGAYISILGSAITTNPTLPAYDETTGEPFKTPTGNNPLRDLQLAADETRITRIVGNISPSFEIIKGLVYKLNYGIDHSNSVRDKISYPSLVPARDGRFETNYKYNNNNLIENYLTFSRTSGDHNYSVLAGHSYQKFFIQDRVFSINKFPITPVDPRYNPGQGTDLTLTLNRPTGTAVKNELQSFFGKVNYAFKDKYLLTAIVRADGSTKFGANNQYGTFPSFSAGWRLSQESFMENLPFDNLMLRAGWGKTGNQEIPSKITQALFTTVIDKGTTYPISTGAYTGGVVYVRQANPDIQWEVSKQTDIGIDFGFMGGALTGSIDYFNKVSSHILLEVTTADPIQPANTTWRNIPSMEISNQGLELALNYQYKASSGFTLDAGANATFIKNEVSGSPTKVIPSGFAVGGGISGTTVNGYINGEPMGTFFMREFTGVNEAGQLTYTDLDGDGITTDADRVVLGSALPTTMYNFNLGASYFGFDLTANFNGVSGNKIYNNTANTNFFKNAIASGLNTTPEATKYETERTDNPKPVSSRYLENGAFLRLNNLSLGYNFSPAKIGVERWVTALRLSVTGQNLFVITDYTGYDPEVNTNLSPASAGGVSSLGLDYLSYPKAKTILFGVNVTF